MEVLEKGQSVKIVNSKPLPGNDFAPEVKEGDIYQIEGVVFDKKGNPHYDIGLKSNLTYIRSYETKENLPDGDKIHWCHPSRLQKI